MCCKTQGMHELPFKIFKVAPGLSPPQGLQMYLLDMRRYKLVERKQPKSWKKSRLRCSLCSYDVDVLFVHIWNCVFAIRAQVLVFRTCFLRSYPGDKLKVKSFKKQSLFGQVVMLVTSSLGFLVPSSVLFWPQRYGLHKERAKFQLAATSQRFKFYGKSLLSRNMNPHVWHQIPNTPMNFLGSIVQRWSYVGYTVWDGFILVCPYSTNVIWLPVGWFYILTFRFGRRSWWGSDLDVQESISIDALHKELCTRLSTSTQRSSLNGQ